MTAYLYTTTFNFYCSGVYSGKIYFAEKEIKLAKVDLRRRTQMQENVLDKQGKYVLPLQKIHEQMEIYAQADWTPDEVVLNNGDVYQKHIQYTAVIAGVERTSQVWALRKGTALDIVTLDGEIIAFLTPNRYGIELIVKEGYEQLTPLVVYDEPLLSKAEYGVNDLGTFIIPMRDGVKLATDVFLPEGIQPGSKLPTILVRTCYDRNGKKEIFMRWANKGYAVVSQDVRGRADSEGELVPFYNERDDGYDSIDWIIAQEWSDGNVGMWGASYLGYVVVAAATSGHPNLKAVVDEVNVGSPFVDTVRKGGTLCSWPLLSWTLAQSVGTRTDFDIFAGITVSPEEAVDARPIKEIPQQMIGKASGPWDLWSQHPEYDDFWRNCTFTERGDQVQVPMYVISGWYDGDSAGVSETWRMLTEHDVPNRKIRLGAWEHGPNRSRELNGVNFGNDAVVYDYDVSVLRWFDHFLKGIPNGIDQEPRASYYVVGENKWRTSDDWTPAEAKITSFYLSSGGRANSSQGDGQLLSAPAEVSPEDMFMYDPHEPMDDSGEREPENLRKYELRNDILVYTSEVLVDDLTVAGELSAVIYAASTGLDTDWVVSLSDVNEQGDSIRLSNYIVRAKYRHGLDHPELLTPGQVEKYDIFMPNIAHRFVAGHRIRFSVTSSSKFVAFPNTNTGENPYEDSAAITVQQTLYHNSEYPSHVLLPVIPHFFHAESVF
ncbi:CocE/NonD family hydrolase [Paenibacillus sp. 19GGS1-52]|uniref:CocE/NonD family hydrolase n=1 Tax=Paenibacillus sp. 19GGS1-52 TaxID=2758563 RepID=UPI001EFA8225|nr:CocE/NonD family hydrolase [Paenibacillus sp. 19GGS1-52]ULO08702.1 CocE/NonD family hydrolase [Paenibacillus sp. 19GGS1-52]